MLALGLVRISKKTKFCWNFVKKNSECKKIGLGRSSDRCCSCIGLIFVNRFSTNAYTEKSFWNLINSIRNQIVFTIFRLIWIQTDVSVWIQINRWMVNTIWFRVDSIRFRKDFSVCRLRSGQRFNACIRCFDFPKYKRRVVKLG